MKPLTIDELQPTGAVLSGMTEIRAVMDACSDAVAARARLEPDRVKAQQRVDDLGQRRADALVERAMQTDPGAVKEHNRRLDAIEAEQAAAARDLEANESAQRALQERIDAAEARAVELNESPLVYTVSGHSSAVTAVLQQRLEDIVRTHLVPFALEAAAMHAATNALREWNSDLRIPFLNRGAAPLMTGERSFVPGACLVFGEAWQDHPALVEACEVASTPRLLVQQLRSLAARSAERLARAAN